MAKIVAASNFKEEILKDARAQLERGIWGFLEEDVVTFGSRKDPGEKVLPKGTIVRVTYIEPTDGKVGISKGQSPGFNALVDIQVFKDFFFES